MTIKEFILKLEYPTIIEIMKNKCLIATFNSDNVEAIKDEMLDYEIHDWYVSKIYYDPHVCINYITKEEENESMV